jgi:hypothetical protein
MVKGLAKVCTVQFPSQSIFFIYFVILTELKPHFKGLKPQTTCNTAQGHG